MGRWRRRTPTFPRPRVAAERLRHVAAGAPMLRAAVRRSTASAPASKPCCPSSRRLRGCARSFDVPGVGEIDAPWLPDRLRRGARARPLDDLGVDRPMSSARPGPACGQGCHCDPARHADTGNSTRAGFVTGAGEPARAAATAEPGALYLYPADLLRVGRQLYAQLRLKSATCWNWTSPARWRSHRRFNSSRWR